MQKGGVAGVRVLRSGGGRQGRRGECASSRAFTDEDWDFGGNYGKGMGLGVAFH